MAYEFNRLYAYENYAFGYENLTPFTQSEMVGQFIAAFFSHINEWEAEECAEVYAEVLKVKNTLPDVTTIIRDRWAGLTWLGRFFWQLNREEGRFSVEPIPSNHVRSVITLGLISEFYDRTEAGEDKQQILESMAAKYRQPVNYGYEANQLHFGLPMFVYLMAAMYNWHADITPPVGALVKFVGVEVSASPAPIRARGASARYLGVGEMVSIFLGKIEEDTYGPYYWIRWQVKEGKVSVLPAASTVPELASVTTESQTIIALAWKLNQAVFSPKRRLVIGLLDSFSAAPLVEIGAPLVREVDKYLRSQNSIKPTRSGANLK